MSFKYQVILMLDTTDLRNSLHLCKGVHSLMPNLGRVLVGDGLVATSLQIPPEV